MPLRSSVSGTLALVLSGALGPHDYEPHPAASGGGTWMRAEPALAGAARQR